MTRPLRTNSTTGIYHVMLRGINRQIIFEHEGDYVRFKRLMMQMTSTTDEQGNPMPPLCTLYAYCLMPNHVHLLIQEKNETISNVIKRIAAAYALYYNKKYEHYGHLFQDRFKSEHAREQGRVCQDAIPNKASEGYRTALQTIKLGAEVSVGESLTKSGVALSPHLFIFIG